MMDGKYVIVNSNGIQIGEATIPPLKLKRGDRVVFESRDFLSRVCLCLGKEKEKKMCAKINIQKQNCEAIINIHKNDDQDFWWYKIRIIGDNIVVFKEIFDWLDKTLIESNLIIFSFDQFKSNNLLDRLDGN